MTKESLKAKTAKGLFWGGLSNGLQQIIGAVFGIIIARILSPDDYGLIGMLAIFTAIANTILDSGFTTALVNRKEIKHEDYNAVFWFSLFAGILLYVILFFSAPLIAQFYNKPELIPLSRFLFLSFLIGSTGIAHNAILFKKMMVKERAKIDIAAVSVSGIVGLILAIKGFAYWGIAIQAVIQTSVAVILRWVSSPLKPTFSFHIGPLKEMFGFGSKLLATNILTQVNANVFSVLLGKFYNEEQVGYYGQGNKWMQLGFMTIGGMISGVAQPIFVEAHEDPSRQRNVFRKILRFGAMISFPAMLGIAFVGEEFILITIGEKWLESVPFMQLLCIWGAFGYIWSLYTSLLMVYGKSNVYLFGMIFICLLQLTAVLLMFPFGIFPMVGIYVFIYFIGLLIWHHFVNKLIGLTLLDVIKDILPYLLTSLGAFSIVWFLIRGIENIYLLFALKISIVGIIYIAVLYGSNSVIFKESIEFFKGKK
jgi:O-antigen/teichoic acid export membrane protein